MVETVARGDTVLCDLNPVVGIVKAIGHLDDSYMQLIGKALSAVLGLSAE